MRVRICWDVPQAAWQRFFDRCPDAPPYHSPAWHDAWNACTGQEIRAVGLRYDDGERAMIVLAHSRAYRNLLSLARSGVGGGYGGLFGPRPLTERHVLLAFKALTRHFPDLRVQSDPNQSWSGVPHGVGTQESSTLRVLLGAREDLRIAYSKNRRRDARFVFEYGVDTGPASGARLDAFLALYHDAATHWLFDRHRRSDAFFRTLAARWPLLSLHIASQHGEPAAARLVGWNGRFAYDLAFVVSQRHRNGHAATAVTEDALIHAFGMGADWFDFMPSGTLRGVAHFKESFGAKPVPVLEFERVSTLGRVLRGARTRLVRGA